MLCVYHCDVTCLCVCLGLGVLTLTSVLRVDMSVQVATCDAKTDMERIDVLVLMAISSTPKTAIVKVCI